VLISEISSKAFLIFEYVKMCSSVNKFINIARDHFLQLTDVLNIVYKKYN